MGVYAQEYGYFFNSQNSDRKYNASSFENWLRPFFLSGVFQGGLAVTAQSTPDMTVNVSAGYANLDGKPARWTSDSTMTIATASGVYDRIDTIVLRRDNANRCISIEVVTGTASASPSPTAPTRDSDTYELVLAQILVGTGVTEITAANITDTRLDSSICGYVAATVDQIDFDTIKNQFDGWVSDQETEFLAWFEEMKNQLSEDAAGNLQLQIDHIEDDIIGSTALPTTAQTLTGAIAEIDTDLTNKTTDLAESIGIVVDGDQAAVSAAVGQYVVLQNSTITDRSDGLYKAALAIPANTSINKTYLTAVSGGGLNALNNNIANLTNHKVTYGSLSANTDLNTIKETGVYTGIHATNNPVGNGIYSLMVIKYSSDWVTQEYHAISDGSSVFVRSYHSGSTWSAWKRVTLTEV